MAAEKLYEPKRKSTIASNPNAIGANQVPFDPDAIDKARQRAEAHINQKLIANETVENIQIALSQLLKSKNANITEITKQADSQAIHNMMELAKKINISAIDGDNNNVDLDDGTYATLIFILKALFHFRDRSNSLEYALSLEKNKNMALASRVEEIAEKVKTLEQK